MKILIADDEYLECEALSKMLTSSIPDLEILPFAATGTELIEKAMACFPDIIVADIHMPRMNGLDALKKVREEMPDVKMVIVTAYGEFEYAKQALKLGSRDYILKPVQPEQFISAVKSVAEEIRSQKKDEQIRRENQRKSEAYEPLVAENFLSSLVLGDLRGENIRRLQDLLRHPYYGGMIFSMGLRTGSPDEEQMLFSAIKAAVDEINCGDTGFALERKGEVVLCVFPGEMEEDEEQFSGKLQAVIRAAVPASLCGQFLLGTGRLKRSIRDLPESYRESSLSLEETKSIGGEGAGNNTDPLRSILTVCGRLMREDNLGGARQMILTAMDQYPQGFSISLKKMRLVYFLYRLGREMESQGRALDWGRINRQFTKDEELKIRPEDVERILKLIRNGDSSGGGNTLIRQSIGFMKEHYMEDLSLNRAAEYCHLNTSYFSRIFSQEIGSSFLDVLTDIRMENAMGLLAGTEHSVQEISERTGYPNTNYFYKVFKKTTGASVSEAREYVRLYGEIKWHSY